MHIGLITYDFDPPIGGLGIHVQRLLQAIRQTSPDQTMIVCSPSPHAPYAVSGLARSCWNKRGGCPVFSLTLLWTLPSFIRNHQPDLLHVQSGSGGVFLLRRQSIPVIVTAHHTYIDEVHLVFTHPLRKMMKWIMSRFEKRTYRIADVILCVSKDTAESVVRHYSIDPAKVRVVENSIDVDRFRTLPVQQRDASHLLFIGRLERRKGIDLLLEAFASIASEHPDLHMTLAGANLMGDWIPSFLKRHHLEDRVHCTGRISDVQMTDLLMTTTLLIVPSRLEGFGLIAAEGMAAGIPVLVNNCPGLRSIVKDKETGRIFTSHLTSILEEMLKDPSQREEMAKRAKEEALVRFDPVRQAQETIDAYRNCKILLGKECRTPAGRPSEQPTVL